MDPDARESGCVEVVVVIEWDGKFNETGSMYIIIIIMIIIMRSLVPHLSSVYFHFLCDFYYKFQVGFLEGGPPDESDESVTTPPCPILPPG